MMNNIMNILDTINYRWIDDETYIYDWSEVLKYKEGNCWEQVELERKLLTDIGINVSTYFISLSDGENYQTHTFLTYEESGKYVWIEHSWEKFKGIYKFDSVEELLKYVKRELIKDFSSDGEVYAFVYLYEKPEHKMKASEFLNYCSSQQLIKLNEPFYFYHVVNKNADLSKGLLSLKYMNDKGLFDLFDKYAEKYRNRIVDSWNIDKFLGRNPDSLTREEIMEGLRIFRGEFGVSYLYFFKYPVYPELGSRMEELLKYKDIVKININDEELQLLISDIFYGYEDSNSDNKLLDRKYYEGVLECEYFSKYDDSKPMNFAALNHISIAFIDDYLPPRFIEKC